MVPRCQCGSTNGILACGSERRRLTTGPSRGCVRPRGAPPSDNDNEAEGVLAGAYAGPLVRGPSQGICKATQDECGRRYSADPSHVLQTTDTNILIRIRSAASSKKSFRETFGAAAVAGYAGPGFHTWPSGHIPQDTAPNPLPRIRSPAKKAFGETFGAAAVAGYAGPGFHTWPSGHILQNTAPNPLPRIRSPAKKSFGETFGAATGVSDPRLQKMQAPVSTLGPQATSIKTRLRIRFDAAGRLLKNRSSPHEGCFHKRAAAKRLVVACNWPQPAATSMPRRCRTVQGKPAARITSLKAITASACVAAPPNP